MYVCFVHRCLSICPLAFSHCVVLSFFDLQILTTPSNSFRKTSVSIWSSSSSKTRFLVIVFVRHRNDIAEILLKVALNTKNHRMCRSLAFYIVNVAMNLYNLLKLHWNVHTWWPYGQVRPLTNLFPRNNKKLY